MTGDWDELLAELNNDQGDDDDDWGVKHTLEPGTTVVGFWRGETVWQGDYGPTPVYLMVDEQGVAFFFFGGRKQLDRRIAEAAPELGDRVAIRRLEDAPAEEGRSPAWRVRVAVKRGDGTLPDGEAVEAVKDPEDADDGIPF